MSLVWGLYLHPIAYASRSLTTGERNYAITELETLVVVWAITHFIPYLYGHDVTVYSNSSGKHARWWTKVYRSGVKNVKIIYRPGRQTSSADALSRSPQAPPPVTGVGQCEVQVAAVNTDYDPVQDIRSLLNAEPLSTLPDSFSAKQQQDPKMQEIISFLENDEHPFDQKQARKIAMHSLYPLPLRSRRHCLLQLLWQTCQVVDQSLREWSQEC